MSRIIQDILDQMQVAADGIRTLATETGFNRSDMAVDDILQHLADTDLSLERYSRLHASCAVLKMGLSLVSKHGDAVQKRKAEVLALWDYDAS